ncbi:MAG TPA: GAF domain-containing protein, partial [bacterium]|nr:GAF domain-containing protein [bacterium]
MPRPAGQGELHRVGEPRENHKTASGDMRATLMARLVAVSDTLRGSLSTDIAAAAIGRALLMLTGAARGAVFLRSQNGIVTCPWSHNLSEDYAGRLRTPEGTNPWAHLSKHPELTCMELPARGRIKPAGPSVIEDVREMPGGNDTRRAAEREGIRAICSWPLSRAGRVFAAMTYYFDAPHECSDAEREVVLAFALQATVTLEQAIAAEARGETAAEASAAAEEAAEVGARLDVEAARLSALQRALDAENARLSAERTDLAVERERLGGARRELDVDRERLDETRRTLETESERFAATRAALEADRKRLADLRNESEGVQAKLEVYRRELDLEQFQLNGVREELDAARKELTKAHTELDADRGAVAQARADLEHERAALAGARADLEA